MTRNLTIQEGSSEKTQVVRELTPLEGLDVFLAGAEQTEMLVSGARGVILEEARSGIRSGELEDVIAGFVGDIYSSEGRTYCNSPPLETAPADVLRRLLSWLPLSDWAAEKFHGEWASKIAGMAPADIARFIVRQLRFEVPVRPETPLEALTRSRLRS
jgi:hypothetical protein